MMIKILHKNILYQVLKLRSSNSLILKKDGDPGLEIATDTVANATNIFPLATKNSSLVAKVATRFLCDLDLN